MRHESVSCDRCGKIKGEANHWLKGATIYGGYLLADAESLDPPEGLMIEDFCSQQCALAFQACQLRPVN